MKIKLSKNIVAWREGMIVMKGRAPLNAPLAATFAANLMKRGYLIDQKAWEALCRCSNEDVNRLYHEVMVYLDDMTGGGKKYEPIYKNFPAEVMQMSDVTFYVNALFHYWSNGNWTPASIEESRPFKLENVKYSIVTLGDEDAFEGIFTKLLSVNTSLTPVDLQVVEWFVKSGEKLKFPDTIPFKENLCTLAAMGIDGIPVKTVTDVLRIAVHMSGGDISLPPMPNKYVRPNAWSRLKILNPARDNFKFKKFTRAERNAILRYMEETNCDSGEMHSRRERWLRLGEILHPGEYKTKYPRAYRAFSQLRDGESKSWNSRLNGALKNGLSSALMVLSERPGEFARKLDMMLRKYPTQTSVILDKFYSVSNGVSNKVTFELIGHFERRKNPNAVRFITPKGARKAVILPMLMPMNDKVVNDINDTLKSCLMTKFSELDSLGLCWVDPDLKKIPLPSNMRSSSATLLPVIRGQRLKLRTGDAKVIRSFVHWTDNVGNTDLDLSVTFFSEKSHLGVVSYSSYRYGNSVHSGDVRHRKGNCAEYVDIDIEDALSRGATMAVVDVRNFNGGSLKKVGGVFGVMGREFPESNDLWLPETIDNCVILESDATSVAMCAVDLVNKEYIMLDVDMEGLPIARGNSDQVMKAITAYTSAPAFSVYDLVMLHVKSRGRLAESGETSDTEFWFDDFATSYLKTAELMGI